MIRIILQPASGPAPRRHYADTVEKPLMIANLNPLPDRDTLLRKHPDGTVRAWGATPGPYNRSAWEQMGEGDIILFYREGFFVSQCTVTHLTDNQALADTLWDRKAETNEAFELMFFLTPPKPINIPYPDVQQLIDYGPKKMLRGLTILTSDQSAAVLNTFDTLESDLPEGPSITVEEYTEAVLELESLDKQRVVAVRTEQRFLRRHHFKGLTGTCGICERDFPVGLLVVAHIKRRAACSDEEKRNYQHNTMPMCVFGCDSLFERGFIVVKNGRVVPGPTQAATKSVEDRVSWLNGKISRFWSESSASYFDWHRRSFDT